MANQQLSTFLHAYAAWKGYNLGCRFIDDDEVEAEPKAQSEPPKPLSIKEEWEKYRNTEFASWAERKVEIDRIKALLQPYLPTEDEEEGEDESEEHEEVCECCGGSGVIYVPRFSSWLGMVEVPIECSCSLPVGIPYRIMHEAIDALSGLNEVQ